MSSRGVSEREKSHARVMRVPEASSKVGGSEDSREGCMTECKVEAELPGHTCPGRRQKYIPTTPPLTPPTGIVCLVAAKRGARVFLERFGRFQRHANRGQWESGGRL